MLGYLILGLLLLAFCHFIIDGILAPSTRLATRMKVLNDLQALDEARAERPQAVPEPAYRGLRSRLHNFIECMPHYTLCTVVSVHMELRRRPELLEEAKARVKPVEECSDSVFAKIRSRVTGHADRTLTWNTMGWMLYLIPVIVAVTMYRSTHRVVRAILAMPEPQVHRFDRASC